MLLLLLHSAAASVSVLRVTRSAAPQPRFGAGNAGFFAVRAALPEHLTPKSWLAILRLVTVRGLVGDIICNNWHPHRVLHV